MSLNDVSDISALLSGEDHDVALLESALDEKRSSIAQQEKRVRLKLKNSITSYIFVIDIFE